MILMKTNIIIDTLLPKKCFSCDDTIANGLLCEICSSLCQAKENPLFYEEQKFASIFLYTLTIKDLITKAKFSHSLPHAKALIELSKNRLYESRIMEKIILFNPECISYVPSSMFDRIKRGFELSLLFAQTMSIFINKPVFDLLQKPLFGPKMSEIQNKQERIMAVNNAFSLKKETHCNRILLIDDVITTQATINHCNKLIIGQNKNKKIINLSIAHTPF